MATVFINNDHILILEGLKNESGEAVEGATVIATLLDKTYTETEVPAWTLADNGEGNYSVQLEDDIAVSVGTSYQMRIRARLGEIKGEWFVPVTVNRRTA